MDYKDLKQAAKVFDQIYTIRLYVSKERFDKVAKAKFGIDDERRRQWHYTVTAKTAPTKTTATATPSSKENKRKASTTVCGQRTKESATPTAHSSTYL